MVALVKDRGEYSEAGRNYREKRKERKERFLKYGFLDPVHGMHGWAVCE